MLNSYQIKLSRVAEIELNEAINWYDLQVLGLSEKFYIEFDRVLNSIARNPYYASIKYNNTHIAYCKKFPYGIHYKIHESDKTVFITSIFHQQQQPFWYKTPNP